MKKLFKYIYFGVDMILYKIKFLFNKEINFFVKNLVVFNFFIFFYRFIDLFDVLVFILLFR